MSDGISPKLCALPNHDLQIDRLMERHQYHCPECNRLCFTTYRENTGSSVYDADMVTHCTECGDKVIQCRTVRGKEVLTVKDTGKKYDYEAERKAAFKRMELADRSNLKKYVDICNTYADELEAETFSDELYVPYVRSMSAIMRDLKKNGLGNLEYACEQALRCCNISKLELFDVMIELYRLVCKNEHLLPRPLYQRIMVEYYILDFAYDGMFYDDNHLYEMMVFCAEDFESLTPEERSMYPFTAVEAYRTAFWDRKRNGTAKETKAMAKKLISSTEDALISGAKADRRLILNYLGALSALSTRKTNPYKAASEKFELFGESNVFKGVVSAAYAEHIFKNKLCDSYMKCSKDDPEAKADALAHIDTALECLEKEIDLEHIGYWLVCSYSIRGILNNDARDTDLAIKYMDFLSDINCISLDDLKDAIVPMMINPVGGIDIHTNLMKVLNNAFIL